MNLRRALFDYIVSIDPMVSIRDIMWVYITIDLFKLVVVVVVVEELFTRISSTSNEMLSVGDIDKNQIRNEYISEELCSTILLA
jgi:hypothetical protein